VLVEQVEDDAAGIGADDGPVDGGAEGSLRVALDAAAEDDLDVAGRPMSRLSPMRASKKKRETSTCRIEHSHQ
jgi:hypothetical protein